MSWSKYDGAYGRQGGRIVPFNANDPEPARCAACNRLLRLVDGELLCEPCDGRHDVDRLFT